MPISLPIKPALSDADVLLLRQVAGGGLHPAIGRATGIHEGGVGAAISMLLTKIGTTKRFHAAALGASWGLVRREDTHVRNPTGKTLPPRHMEILAGLAAGEDVVATAKRLGLTANTVRTYTQTILTTLGVRSREQAAAVAVLDDLVSLRALGDSWPDMRLSEVPQPAGAH
ncbi:helix-turn-helix transcriptional regulator [Kitasatospora sp. NPDC056731]|uniref:helix-turn-helix transcriptional regulator n=1 Tax=Kitasatospora sp. NPDC056731 TaxID=3155422 RepID=UPI003437E8BA